MAFRPVPLLDSIGAEYTPFRENVGLRCPWCGDDDEKGDNFSIRIDGRAWKCWRDRSHTSNVRGLVQKLTGWGWSQVDSYLGVDAEPSPLDELKKRAAALSKPKAAAPSEVLQFEPGFRDPRPGALTGRFLRYLEDRGFDDPAGVARRYGLKCAVSGRFHDRLILPVHSAAGLVGWTARAIGPAKKRYLAHPEGGRIKDALFNERLCRGGEALVVVEGPVDALKIDWYGQELDVNACGLMNTSATDSQAATLARLARLYGRVWVVLDAGAQGPARALVDALPGVGASVARLPGRWKDPGELPKEAAVAFLRSLLEKK